MIFSILAVGRGRGMALPQWSPVSGRGRGRGIALDQLPGISSGRGRGRGFALQEQQSCHYQPQGRGRGLIA